MQSFQTMFNDNKVADADIDLDKYGKNDKELHRADFRLDRDNDKRVSKYVGNMILITALSTKVTRASLENLFKQVDGFKRLILSEPNK